MMRAITIAVFLLSVLAPLSPAHAQFRQLIDPLMELFQPKPKPNPSPRPAEPVPLPPMNPLQQPEEAAPAQETGEAAAVEPPVPLPPMKPMQEIEAPATPPAPTDSGAADAGEPPSDKLIEVEWSQTELVEALSACIARLGPIVAEVEPLSPIKARHCGTAAPVRLKRLGRDPGVEFSPAATLNCDMVIALDTWIRTVVQPAAERLLGSRIVRLRTASSYSCRNRNGAADGPISEHAFANALDVSGFITTDGREVAPLERWGPTQREIEAARRATAETGTEAQPETAADMGELPASDGSGAAPAADPGPTPEAEFLREIHKAACGVFGTVLGPEANDAHKDHFHLDLALRRHGAYCE